MSYCSGYIGFFFLMIVLMFMDVGDTHDEAIFGSLFVYLYKNYFHVNYLKSSIEQRGYTPSEVVMMQLRRTQVSRLTLVRPVSFAESTLPFTHQCSR